MKRKPIELLAMVTLTHGLMVSNGFWEDGQKRNVGEALMLVGDELSEGHEAFRCGEVVEKRAAQHAPNWSRQELFDFIKLNPSYQRDRFKFFIKDTLEDEIADAYYRLCDMIGGFGLPLDKIERDRLLTFHDYKTLGTKVLCMGDWNVGEALMTIQGYITGIYHDQVYERSLNPDLGPGMVFSSRYGVTIALLEVFADVMDFDLELHLQLKHEYNATRPHKHGKAY